MKKTCITILMLAFCLPSFAQSVKQEAQANVLKEKHKQKVTRMQELLKYKEQLAQQQVANDKDIEKLDAMDDSDIVLSSGSILFSAGYVNVTLVPCNCTN